MRPGKAPAVWAAVSLAGLVAAAAPNEPTTQTVYLGAWVDTSVAGADSPTAFNSRTQLKPQVFVLEQTIPLTAYNATTGTGGAANASFVEVTGTDAHIFLNVVPVNNDLTIIQDSDYSYVASQVAAWTAAPYSRSVYVNFGPRMNDPDVLYGLQPTAYVAAYKALWNAVKSANENVAMVWTPTASEGYPYGLVLSNIQSTADQALLDTVNPEQHVLTNADDAYEGYYPGDGYVDWVGIFYEYRGAKNPLDGNTAQPVGTIDGALTGASALNLSISGTQTFTPWYSTYCQVKAKPCAFIGGAAFHSNTTAVQAAPATQQAIQQEWLTDGMANATLIAAYPQIKLWALYEFSVVEDYMYDQRDYRLTIDTTVLSSFQSAFAGVSGSFQQAATADIPSDLSGTSPTGVGLSGVAAATGTGRVSVVSTLPAQTKSGSVFASGAHAGQLHVSAAAVVTSLAVALGVGMGGWIGMRP